MSALLYRNIKIYTQVYAWKLLFSNIICESFPRMFIKCKYIMCDMGKNEMVLQVARGVTRNATTKSKDSPAVEMNANNIPVYLLKFVCARSSNCISCAVKERHGQKYEWKCITHRWCKYVSFVMAHTSNPHKICLKCVVVVCVSLALFAYIKGKFINILYVLAAARGVVCKFSDWIICTT